MAPILAAAAAAAAAEPILTERELEERRIMAELGLLNDGAGDGGDEGGEPRARGKKKELSDKTKERLRAMGVVVPGGMWMGCVWCVVYDVCVCVWCMMCVCVWCMICVYVCVWCMMCMYGV